MKDRVSRREFIKMSGVFGGGVVLALLEEGCTTDSGVSPITTNAPVDVYQATEAATATATTAAPVQETVTARPPEQGAGGPMDEKLFQEILSSPWIQKQVGAFEVWRNYWARGGGFDPYSADWHYDLVFDPTNMPKDKWDNIEQKVNITLNWSIVDSNGNLILKRAYLPIDYINTDEATGVVYQTVPPDLNFIETGTGYMEIYDQPGTKLVWRGNEWIQIDPVTGKKRMQIQRHNPWNWEDYSPWDVFNTKFVTTYKETHIVELDNGQVINYSIETDQTKSAYPVEINEANCPGASRTVAGAIQRALSSILTPGGNLRLEAYWDNETTPRWGEMPYPAGEIRIIFADQFLPNNFDPPLSTSWLEPPEYASSYVIDGQLIIVVLKRVPVSQDMQWQKAGQEVGGLGFALSALTGRNKDIYTGQLEATCRVLKVKH